MTELGTHWEAEDLRGGLIRHTQYIKRHAYRDDNGNLRRIANNWQDSGVPGRPHIITAAPFIVSAGEGGMRRIHPTRELDRYVEIGAPFVKVGGDWQQVNLGAPTRKGNLLQWIKPQANMYLRMAGHYIKLAILLKGGWVPEDNLIAFPVGLHGLTRSGGQILADGVPVMSMRAPHVEDYDNPDDVRPVAHQFVRVGSQWHVLLTLPSLAGMSRPLLDPTLTLQPDATDGLDTYIREVGTFHGTADELFIGNYSETLRRGLYKFNLSTLPTTAIISSATLSLYCTWGTAADVASTHAIYRQKRAWNEIQVDWAVYSTGNSWQSQGGFGANDCEQTYIGSRDFTDTEALNAWKDFPLTPTTKAALDLGNGWLIKSITETATDCHGFSSSDHAIAANRPKLTFVYSLPAATGPVMLRKIRLGF